ncbi:MAG: hypothetical protein QOF78_389 [Phycisphaerales bacterium]|jgi:hypothetical protein|nr:hypothetical protein [Phycisphaerales bacterium]
MFCVEPLERRMLMNGTILFIRGATRSGGFLDGGAAAQRDDQLADINNASTAAGNHGWATLAQTLRGAGFVVEQMTEPKEPSAGDVVNGRPIRFENLDLTRYDAIVFGSNNARYPRASVDAIDNYIRGGGGALFISDANFGSHWRDSPDSDQAFLARYGLVVNQDTSTYAVSRALGHFIVPSHPILNSVEAFDGEGINPIVMPAAAPPPGVTITRVVAARNNTRNNDGVDPAENFAGSIRHTTSRDAALVLANAGRGRIAGYFDRNTFFNANGAGTDIQKNDNRQLALNLFDWVSDNTPPAVTKVSFAQGAPSELRITFDDSLFGSLTRRDVLLRDPFTAEPVSRKRWSFAVVESDGKTELIIKIKGAQPPGTYQLQINPGHIVDDSGNANLTRIRHNFVIGSTGSVVPRVTRADAKAQATSDASLARVSEELFGDELILE